MNADSDKISDAFADQLSSFEQRLDSKIDDVNMLADIQAGIRRLLGTQGGNEATIRRVLQDRYENGDLRKETFQLVKSMLDGFVTENNPTDGAPNEPHATTVNEIESGMAPEKQGQTGANAGDVAAQQNDPLSSTMELPIDQTLQAAAADERVQIGSVLRDRFLLQERVGAGSMGVVYKALDRRLAEAKANETFVAIKVLSADLAENGDALRALQQEAAKGRCLTHSNIVRFIDLDRDDDLYFIVMEWLEGRTLADILDSSDAKSIDVTRAFEIVHEVGSALDYAHRCGIVHADVKPGNIMITPGGEAKLFDFGVARVRQKQAQDQPDFDPGVLGLLTPAYSSMQVLTGEDPAPADDVFSLACLLYRLIAGYRVFGPRNAAEAAEEGMQPQQLQNISAARWRVVNKALSYSRVARYDSVTAFIQALDADHKEPPATITVPIRNELDDHDDSPSAVRWIGGFVVLVGVLAAAAYQFDLLDELKQKVVAATSGIMSLAEIAADTEPALADTPLEAVVDGIGERPVAETADDTTKASKGADFASEHDAAPGADAAAKDASSASEAVQAELVDYSLLPPATAEIRLAEQGSRAKTITVNLREDAQPVTVDLIRADVDVPLTVKIEEIGFSGNRSPWVSGQYEYSENGVLEFPQGQARARLTLTMASDPLREADQQSTLRIREAVSGAPQLAIIKAILEDDDQRSFEANLPANTVAFAVSQISVRERDPAVQIDVLRFNPDNTALVVGYSLHDITATQGEDYFAPGGYTIEFGPGQRTARLLIPLVQDFEFEDNEAFSVELVTSDSVADTDVFRRSAVIIRDDDS